MAGDTYWEQTALAMHMDGVNNSTSFVDMKGKTVTAIGNVKISTAQSIFGGASAVFDGSGDYLSVPNSADLNFGASNFTVEFWVFFPVVPGAGTYQVFVSKRYASSSDNGWFVNIGGTEGLGFSYSTTGVNQIANYRSWSPVANTWYHVEIVRSGASLLFFVNGVQLGGAVSIGADSIYASTSALAVGAGSAVAPSSYLNAYIDDLRITKGVARHTANFTPPASRFDGPGSVVGTVKDAAGNLVRRLVRLYRRDSGVLVGEMFSDPVTGAFSFAADDYTMHFVVVNDIDSLATYLACDGADNSTDFVEWSGKSVTRYGDPKISTAQSKFGGSSAYFDGVDDYLHISRHSDFGFGVGDFTIEVWVRTTSTTVLVVETRDTMTVEQEGAYYIGATGKISYYGNVTGVKEGTTQVNTGTWVHLCWCRAAGVLRMFVNGVQEFSGSFPVDLGATRKLRVAANDVGSGLLAGYVDDLLIAKGVARRIANFSPPSSPQVPVGNQKNALVYDLLTPV